MSDDSPPSLLPQDISNRHHLRTALTGAFARIQMARRAQQRGDHHRAVDHVTDAEQHIKRVIAILDRQDQRTSEK